MQTPSEQKLFDTIQAIGNCDARAQALYNAEIGLRTLRAKLEAEALVSVEWQGANWIHPSGDAIAAAARFEIYFASGSGKELAQLASLRAGVEMLENLPEVIAAREMLEPLCAERDRLRLVIKAEKQAFADAEQAAADAHAEAVRKAVEKAEADPLVVKTREALAKLSEHPLAPVRGKIAIRSHVEAEVAG